MEMDFKFDPLMVTLSIAVAIFASYVALNLANNVTQAKGKSQAVWLTCGALAMGVGIWSMHFIGMLAFEMPGMTMAYDVFLMALSIVVAIGASALALYIVSRPFVPLGSILSGGIAMAAAIAGMHYIGMYSMRMGAVIKWNAFLIVLSVLIALCASFGALFILIRLRDKTEHLKELLLASTVMGAAIAGMHYTGMYAATFVHTEASTVDSSNLLVSSGLTFTVTAMTLIILGLALAGSVGQRLWERKDKATKDILIKSEERFRRLVEAVKDYSILMLDPKGYITTWNSGAQRLSGYSESEVIGKHISVFYTKEDIEGLTADKELEIAEKTGHFEGEGVRIKKDSTAYWASIVISPLFDPQGKLTGFSKVTRDITEIKASEKSMRQLNEELEKRVRARTQALQYRERQLRTITDAVPVLLAQFDKEQRFLFVNEAFVSWFQQDERAIRGKSFREVVGEERYSYNQPYIQKALSGEVATYERESESGDRKAVFSVTLVPEFDKKHEVSGFIVVANDITQQKQIQTELKQAKEAAESANSAKSAFLANMSHEIRTPLGAVLGYSELLLNGEMSDSERVDSVEVIKRNGRLLSNIINDILDLSKVEAGRLQIEKVNVPFNEVMKEIGSVLNLEASAKGIELKVTSEGVMPDRIKTDPLRLRQILFNIVGNAIKFTHRGSVHVKVKLLASAADDRNKLAFIVKDTGAGIKPEQIERLFSPFSQADVSTTRRFGGTGLGLVLSKKLAKALGGDVYLSETAPGAGSTFVVTIDPEISEQVLFEGSNPPASPDKNLVVLPGPKQAHLKELKILVVDDSIDNQRLIQRILRLAGASIDTANNGREAVDKALDGDYSLILMDLQMPEMDGYEATKILRAKGYTKPIIALTAHAMKEDRERSLESGFDNHITKPIDHTLLIRALSEYSA